MLRIQMLAWQPGPYSLARLPFQDLWWGDTGVTDRTLDSVISRLRRKIARDSQDPAMLLTRQGAGYKFADRD